MNQPPATWNPQTLSVLFVVPMLATGCCNSGTSDAATGPDPGISAVATALAATAPPRAVPAVPASSHTPGHVAPGTPNPTCKRVEQCCVAMASKPGLEDAQPLCQMYWLRGVVEDHADVPDREKLEELCQLEMVQLQNIWNLHSLEEPGRSQKMPSVCRWAHPTRGPMPFTPLGPAMTP